MLFVLPMFFCFYNFSVVKGRGETNIFFSNLLKLFNVVFWVFFQGLLYFPLFWLVLNITFRFRGLK